MSSEIVLSIPNFERDVVRIIAALKNESLQELRLLRYLCFLDRKLQMSGDLLS